MDKLNIHSEASQSVLKALLYYDIFDYPLTRKEVFTWLSTNHVTEPESHATLTQLCAEKYIYQLGNFFSIQNNASLAERREKGNQEAAKFLKVAQRQANFIHSFPFVRSVMASGSLSKNYMDENSDLDFFIITSPGRLWIARTLLIFYKRTFLFNSHKYFCVNYFVDEHHLEIEEKNIYTATELSTLIPLSGDSYYPLLFNDNTWIKDFFPNHVTSFSEHEKSHEKKKIKSVLEELINFLGGDRLDTFFMHLTFQRWKRMYEKKYDVADFQIAFKTKKYASKNHPNFYQKKVMDLYKEKLVNFARKANIQWIHE
jgi:hypothetical protein